MTIITTLRFAPWHDRSHLSQSQYGPLTVAVSKVLQHALSTPDSRLDVAWARAFVRTYVQDDAKHTLQVLDTGAKESKLTAHEILVRKSTLQLAQRLAKIRDGLDASVLVDLAVSYGAGNASSLRTIFQEACKATPSLRESLKTDVVPAFGASLQEVQNRSAASTRKVAYVLSQLLSCGSVIVTSFVQDKDFVLTLARCYHAGLDNFANYHGGFTLQNPEAVAGWQRDWLYTKTSLVDSFHAIVLTLLQGDQPDDKDRLFDLLFSILELPSSSSSEHSTPIPFISQSLLADYNYAFDLFSALSDKFQGVDDARVDLLTSALAELSPSPRGAKPAGGLSFLIQNEVHPRQSQPTTVSKEKGKAKAPHQDSQVRRLSCWPFPQH
jgi:activating signal cointegrator complex subunit 2